MMEHDTNTGPKRFAASLVIGNLTPLWNVDITINANSHRNILFTKKIFNSK